MNDFDVAEMIDHRIREQIRNEMSLLTEAELDFYDPRARYEELYQDYETDCIEEEFDRLALSPYNQRELCRDEESQAEYDAMCENEFDNIHYASSGKIDVEDPNKW